MSEFVQIKIDAENHLLLNNKANALQIIATRADYETLSKIAELIQKPGACEKFKKALNNDFVKRLFLK